MPKLKVLSGKDVVKILKSFGFAVVARKGSHIKLIRITGTNFRQTLTIPLHDELDKGTLKAIYRQASKYIAEDDLFRHFYTE